MSARWNDLTLDERARKFVERATSVTKTPPNVTAEQIAQWLKSPQAERMARRIADVDRWMRGDR